MKYIRENIGESQQMKEHFYFSRGIKRYQANI
jgi:hypothetical protein